MGRILKFVADDVLRETYGEKCQQCERSNIPAYSYAGEIVNPHLAADAQLAQDNPEVYYLCADCINGGNVKRTDTWAVQETVARFALNSEQVWRDFNQLPDLPLFLQGKLDWPICCATWCEFTGTPINLQELLAVQKSHQYWESGPSEGARSFKSEGAPESLRELSMFHCCACDKRYYTDQFT